jgi:hypothetical protein
VRPIGEATAGAPSQWGDATTVDLSSTGLIARVATTYQRYGRPSARTTPPMWRCRSPSRTSSPGATRYLARALAAG